jgi:metal-dependent amidase/aminoacylase/carboxypeptidase family protein
VIPDYTAAEILVRSRDVEYLAELNQRFRAIVEAAALATGTRVEITEGLTYKPRVCNTALVETYRDNLLDMGLKFEVPPADQGVGSSDIGDVSQLVPTIHPYMKICNRGVAGHTPEFAAASASPRADELIATGSTLLAWTAADVLLNPQVRDRLREAFLAQMGREPQA